MKAPQPRRQVDNLERNTAYLNVANIAKLKCAMLLRIVVNHHPTTKPTHIYHSQIALHSHEVYEPTTMTNMDSVHILITTQAWYQAWRFPERPSQDMSYGRQARSIRQHSQPR